MPFKFVYVCDLLQQLEDLEYTDRDIALPSDAKNSRYYKIVSDWFRNHRKLIDNAATDKAALLSTLLPERRVDRVYRLQPPSLLKVLCRSLRIGTERLKRLKVWSPANEEDLSSWVTKILKATDPGMPPCIATIEEIDVVLEQVAAKCRYSSREIRSSAVAPVNEMVDSLLSPLLNNLPSRELKWFLRLVLKKFSPVFLEENLILKQAHFLLPRILKFKSDFAIAIELLNHPSLRNLPTQPDIRISALLSAKIATVCFRPQIGVKVGRPHFEKVRSFEQCLKLTKNSRWSIEPKIDGEYCQIHIDLSKSNDWLQIFSKYGRDSTEDRRGLHQWIRQCLRIGSPECQIKNHCILEGEMVVFNDNEKCIADFHKIRKHVSRAGSFLGTENDSQAHPYEKLTIVFFDVLLVDDEILMSQPYHERRKKLKHLILVDNEGCTKDTDFELIDFSALSEYRARKKLERYFASAIANRYEGLVLKPYDRPYFQGSQPHPGFAGFLKMKRDYIPGLGDTADFAVIGACRDTRAETIHKSKWNRFIIACIVNKDEVDRFDTQPILQAMETISRPCISEEDARYISLTGVPLERAETANDELNLYSLIRGSFTAEIEVQFKIPFITEVTGSGFDKAPSRNHYNLRHPRMTKIHGDRTMKDIVSFDELQNIAHEARTKPSNSKAEESKWIEYLRGVNCSSRSRFINEQSQFSEATSNDTSPCTVKSGETQSQRSSPLIRMDSSELLPGESRELCSSPLQDRQEQDHSRNLGLPLTPPPTAPLCTKDDALKGTPENKGVETTRNAKRKRDDHQLSTTAGLSPAKRVCNAKTNHSSESDCRNTTLLSKHRPLSDITNDRNVSDPHSISLISSCAAVAPRRLDHSAAELKSNSSGLGSDDSFFSTVTKISDNENVNNDERPLHTDMSVQCLIQEDVGTKGRLDSAPNKKVDIEVLETVENQKGYLEARTKPPLELSVVYISECLQTVPYLTENLLPMLGPAHVTRSLTHWSRDLLYLSPFAPVVGESQAYPHLQKVVLVEGRRKTATKEVIRNLLTIKLEYGEEMRVWDWRVAERLVEYMRPEHGGSLQESQESGDIRFGDVESQNLVSQDQGRSLRKEDLLVEKLARYYLGTVAQDNEQRKTVWVSADSEAKRRVATDLVSVFTPTSDV